MVIRPYSRKKVVKIMQGSSSGTTPTSTNTTRPRPPTDWNVNDVVKWFERHVTSDLVQYSNLFRQNNICGRSLLRINAAALERMGIENHVHREEIWREIIKLKLKADILELRNIDALIILNKK